MLRRLESLATTMTTPAHLPALLLVLLGLAAGEPALAGRDALMPAMVPPAYVAECGSCHLAYPPALLPAPSWQRLMRGLDKHFGSDASLDAATLLQIERWLQAHAGTGKRVDEAPAQDRITRSAWFERKHRRIDPTVWQLTSVRSAANCGACHGGAARGSFDDDDLKLPEGIAMRLRGPWKD